MRGYLFGLLRSCSQSTSAEEGYNLSNILNRKVEDCQFFQHSEKSVATTPQSLLWLIIFQQLHGWHTQSRQIDLQGYRSSLCVKQKTTNCPHIISPPAIDCLPIMFYDPRYDVTLEYTPSTQVAMRDLCVTLELFHYLVYIGYYES